MNSCSGIQMARPTTRAIVPGGGFIGLEMVENLRQPAGRGLAPPAENLS
jgi:hypothetical protein